MFSDSPSVPGVATALAAALNNRALHAKQDGDPEEKAGHWYAEALQLREGVWANILWSSRRSTTSQNIWMQGATTTTRTRCARIYCGGSTWTRARRTRASRPRRRRTPIAGRRLSRCVCASRRWRARARMSTRTGASGSFWALFFWHHRHTIDTTCGLRDVAAHAALINI